MLGSSWLCKRYELQVGPPEHLSATSVVLHATDRSDKNDFAKILMSLFRDTISQLIDKGEVKMNSSGETEKHRSSTRALEDQRPATE